MWWFGVCRALNMSRRCCKGESCKSSTCIHESVTHDSLNAFLRWHRQLETPDCLYWWLHQDDA